MNRDIVYTPSNLKTFMQCPFKFKAMTLDKSVPYVQGEAAKRGEHLHAMMETALKHGWDSVNWDDEKSRDHAYKFYCVIHGLVDKGWDIHIEDSVATDGYGHALDFWDKAPNNLFRCRIDCWLENKNNDTVFVFDHKSGRKYEADRIQLQVNAVCLKPVTQRDKYVVNFDYLDNGALVTEKIDITDFNLWATDPLEFASSPCLELLNAFTEVNNAIEFDRFIPKKNRFCSFCPLYENGPCPHGHK